MIRLVIGWILILAGVTALAHDAIVGIERGHFALSQLGALWYAIDRGSLNLVQAVTERYLHPFLWDPVLFTVISLPAAPLFALLGGLLLYWLRRSRLRRTRWRR